MMSAARAWVRAAVVGSSLAEPILWAPETHLKMTAVLDRLGPKADSIC